MLDGRLFGRHARGAGTAMMVLVSWATAAAAELVHSDSARVEDASRADERGLALPPLEAEGDIHFTTDVAVLFDASGRYVLETYLLVPHTALKWIRSGPSYRAELEIRIDAESGGGRRSRELTAKRSLSARDFEETRRIDARSIVTVTGDLSFRPDRVDVELMDLRAAKNTLIGRLRGDKKSGRVELMLPVTRALSERDELSSLVFATASQPRENDETPPGTVARGEVVVHPNPTHFVGRDLEVFPVYFEVYQRSEDGGFEPSPQPRTLHYRITRADGVEVLSTEDAIDAAGGRWGRIQRFDVSGFPTGTYVLSVELRDEARERLDVAYGEFHVLWRDYTWLHDEATVLENAEVLLAPEEFERFELMPEGERAAYLAQLWEALDGAAESGGGDSRQKFHRRLERAERLYGGLEGGKRSDRGRVLIRYGEPQEIIPMRIPNRRDTFREIVASELAGSLSSAVDLEDPRLLDFFRRYSRGNPPFEIWKYFAGGDPIIEDLRGPPRGMAFIFVDETGVGIYALGYTNVRGIN